MASTTAKLTQEPVQHAQKVALIDTHAERATIALRRHMTFTMTPSQRRYLPDSLVLITIVSLGIL
jgi:hypothetical protein